MSSGNAEKTNFPMDLYWWALASFYEPYVGLVLWWCYVGRSCVVVGLMSGGLVSSDILLGRSYVMAPRLNIVNFNSILVSSIEYRLHARVQIPCLKAWFIAKIPK